ncbi:hypothetical protein 8014-B2_00107 [Lactobacillus phage ATCC 8014-B2]|uniref:Uncharacterized protein n=1 Tax=Lactobacillus phage ATCC 8014-B2 TaxID=1225795 RepID=K4IDB3_9CAUD|nr:hypothetical protein HOQ89_gp039 [Lactobacillus phage ATCC 8014-B2]AFU63174.1 hypothetical protein 8014-B2_00107 [Lactobacillus phage ATCC 8014-B2]
MFYFKDDDEENIIVLSHVTYVYKKDGEPAFSVYQDDSEKANKLPIKFYDSFIDKLTGYIDGKSVL